jgi:hypothetical protein
MVHQEMPKGPQGQTWLKSLAEGNTIQIKDAAFLHMGATLMKASASAWSYFTKALIGHWFLSREEWFAANPEEGVSASEYIRRLKAEYCGWKGPGKFIPTSQLNTFFSKARKLGRIYRVYHAGFFFNGNIPFERLGDLSAKDEKLYECAVRLGLDREYSRVMKKIREPASFPEDGVWTFIQREFLSRPLDDSEDDQEQVESKDNQE